MTVAKLIEQLKQMPQDAEVKTEYIHNGWLLRAESISGVKCLKEDMQCLYEICPAGTVIISMD